MSKFHAIYNKGGVSPEPGGDTYGEVQTLLWTNSSPNTNFSAQKITLDLSKYDGVIIEYAFSTTKSQVASRIKLEKNITYAHGGGYFDTGVGNARNVTVIDDTGVTFTENKDSVAANNVNIPLNIYGYKRYESGNLSTDANEIVVEVNTDKQLDAKSYYLILGVSMTTELSLSKGTLIGSIKQSHAGGNDVAAIVYTGDNGIINSTGNSLHIKKINVG